MVETEDAEMLFEPRDLSFSRGETVRFLVTDTGYLEHEFGLDTPAGIEAHKASMEEFPEMEHDDPNAIRLRPGETGEIDRTFANDGASESACLIPGPYQSGMHGPVVVDWAQETLPRPNLDYAMKKFVLSVATAATLALAGAPTEVLAQDTAGTKGAPGLPGRPADEFLGEMDGLCGRRSGNGGMSVL